MAYPKILDISCILFRLIKCIKILIHSFNFHLFMLLWIIIFIYYPLWWTLRSQTKIFLDKYRIKTLNWNRRTPKVHIQVRGINFTKPRHKFGWKFTSKHFQQHYLPPSPISALPFHPFVGFTSLIVSQSTLRMNTQTSIYTPLTPQYPQSHTPCQSPITPSPPPKDQSYWWFPTLIFLMVFFPSTHSPTGMLLPSMRDNTYTGCNFGVYTRGFVTWSSCFWG